MTGIFARLAARWFPRPKPARRRQPNAKSTGAGADSTTTAMAIPTIGTNAKSEATNAITMAEAE